MELALYFSDKRVYNIEEEFESDLFEQRILMHQFNVTTNFTATRFDMTFMITGGTVYKILLPIVIVVLILIVICVWKILTPKVSKRTKDSPIKTSPQPAC